MHMSDALLSPVIGGTFWAASAAIIGLATRKISSEADGSKTVLMGVLGAFVFAAQMINFTIPGTGSSGHLGGGLLLAVLLGPWRAFITLASVLVIQALFFADGGLLALGCNIFNLAFFPAFVAWPFIYRPIAGDARSGARLAAGSITAATAGLLLGAMSVVMQTSLSGISDLPFRTFTLFMMPLHLCIGIVEGLVTWAVLSFVAKTEPTLLAGGKTLSKPGFILPAFVVATMTIGGVLSWFASSRPDGLEWSITRASGKEALVVPDDKIHSFLASVQKRAALLPDYGFRERKEAAPANTVPPSPVDPGTSISGIAGSLMVMLLAGSAGLLLRRRAPETPDA
jgi:cobalt/nickel transport system permease protein